MLVGFLLLCPRLLTRQAENWQCRLQRGRSSLVGTGLALQLCCAQEQLAFPRMHEGAPDPREWRGKEERGVGLFFSFFRFETIGASTYLNEIASGGRYSSVPVHQDSQGNRAIGLLRLCEVVSDVLCYLSRLDQDKSIVRLLPGWVAPDNRQDSISHDTAHVQLSIWSQGDVRRGVLNVSSHLTRAVAHTPHCPKRASALKHNLLEHHAHCCFSLTSPLE